MSTIGAFVDGLNRVKRAPVLVVGAWIATLLLAMPLAIALHGQLDTHLGASIAAESAASGINYDWWNEFLGRRPGLGQLRARDSGFLRRLMKNLTR